MPTDFSQWLTFILIAMLFGKDNVLPIIMRKLGLQEPKETPKETTDANTLATALKKVLVEDDNSPILVKARISRVCDRIDNIDVVVGTMSEDIQLIKKIIVK